MKIGEILRDKAGLSEEQIDRALAVQRDTDKRLGSILVEMGLVDPDVVAESLAELKQVPPAKRAHFQHIDPAVLALVPAKLARRYGAVPLGVSTKLGKTLVVAMRDPTDAGAIETIQFACGMDVRPAAASAFFIDQCVEQFYPGDEPPLLELDRGPSAAPIVPPSAAPIVPPSAAPIAPPSAAPNEGAYIRKKGSLRLVSILLSVAGFAAGGYVYKRACRGTIATQAVSGTFEARHAGLEIDFPEGWNYLPGKNETKTQNGMKARMSLFYRGGTPDIPRDALIAGYLDTGDRLPSMSDERFLGLVKMSARNMRSPGAGQYSMSVGQCLTSGLRDEQAGECKGTATYKGKTWNILVVMWLGEEGRVFMAAPMARDPLDEARDWMGPLITSMAAL